MKKLLHLTLLLSFTCFAQPEKDSLLARDHDKVIRQLKMMRYLDSIVTQEMVKSGNGTREIHRSFYRFYLDTIAGQSPFGFKETANYLGYQGTTGPGTWKDFRSKVYSRNIDEVCNITWKYGYVSPKRLNAIVPGKYNSIMLYATRDYSADKKIKKIFKKEYKVGNLGKEEYEYYKFMRKRKGILNKEDVEYLQNNTSGKINFSKVDIN